MLSKALSSYEANQKEALPLEEEILADKQQLTRLKDELKVKRRTLNTY